MNPARALWNRDRLGFFLAAIAAATVVSGLVQVLAPGFVLDLLDAESTTTTRHFFGIVGMFMAIVGGLLLHSLVASPRPPNLVVAWASLQKLGAAVAVTIGVACDVFSELALLVAGFDLLTAVVGAVFLWRARP